MFRCPLFQTKSHLLSTVWLTEFQSPGNFEINWGKQYMVNFMGLLGMINATVYTTETIFGHEQSKLS